MKIPAPLNSIPALIDAYHEQREEKPRAHLGASMLGHPCDRWLWLSFRWAVQEKFSGRMLRLFRRGHREEDVIVSDLRAIGIDIRDTGESQSRVDFGAHVSGSIDGIICSGVPEAPKKKHLAEFKTHSRKSFDELSKNGVEKSKPVHYAQMQCYMLGKEIDRALYVAVCKDTNRLHVERVKLNKELAERYIARGRSITLAERMPPPISTDPSWYQCKFCAAHEFCHDSRLTQHINCRTCAHSTPLEDSTWRCELHNADGIPTQFQHDGCDSHVLHVDLVPWQLDAERSTEHVACWNIGGHRVMNGKPQDDGSVFASTELVANLEACMNMDDGAKALREAFQDRVVG